MNIRIKRLELQQAMLDKKAMTYNVGALLVKEMQYNQLDTQVAALEDYITAVEQHRAALEVPSLRIMKAPALSIVQITRALSLQPVVRPRLAPPVLSLPAIRMNDGDHLRAAM